MRRHNSFMEPSRLTTAVAEAWPVDRWCDVTVVVAVSGGADSVALLRSLIALRRDARDNAASAGRAAGNLIVAHVNHHLRGAASDADERFVVDLCTSQAVECIVGHAAPRELADQQGDGLEAACRSARYEFLLATAEQRGARYVATAHTADDQAETVLHHLLRGTGLAGLGGMAAFRPMSDAVTLARPLLAVRRSDVLAYLASLGQPFREDETNRHPEFTRNRIRHELLPLVERDYNADIVAALLRTARQAREAHEVIRAAAESLADQCVSTNAGNAADDVADSGADRSDQPAAAKITIHCQPLRHANRHIVREMFVAIWRRQSWPRQAMRFDHWDALAEMAITEMAIAEMARAEPPQTSRTFPGEVTATRSESQLTLHRTANNARPTGENP